MFGTEYSFFTSATNVMALERLKKQSKYHFRKKVIIYRQERPRLKKTNGEIKMGHSIGYQIEL